MLAMQHRTELGRHLLMRMALKNEKRPGRIRFSIRLIPGLLETSSAPLLALLI
jgi:hypothetical protein